MTVSADHPTAAEERVPSGAGSGSSRPLGVVLLLALALYVAGAVVIASTRGVWSPDCGARMIQVFSILQHPPEWWVPYPAAGVDPEHSNSALYFYEFVHGGRTYIFYSALFAELSALFFRLLGYPGLMVLPILGGLTAAAATWAIAGLLRFRAPWVTALLVALASPVAVYSTVFWDHSLLTGLAAVALYLALRGVVEEKPVLWLWAGMVLGAGLWIHELLLPFVPALVVAAWWLRRETPWLRVSVMLAAGTALFAVPLGVANELVYGTPLGPHLSNNEMASAGSIFSFLTRPAEWTAGALYTLFFWGNNSAGFTHELVGWLSAPSPAFRAELTASAWMAVPLLLWLGLALSGLWVRIWPLSLAAITGMAAAAIWVMVNGALAHSLFLASPALAVAFAAPLRARGPVPDEESDASFPERRRLLQALALATAVYALPVLIKPSLGGTEWGARHLLAIVPALALLGWSAVEPLMHESGLRAASAVRAALLGGIAALLVLSLGLQGKGFQLAYQMHRHSERLTQILEKTPDEVVVSSVWWAPLQAPSVYFRKLFLYAGDREHPASPLFERLRAAGYESYTLIGYGPWDLALFSAPAGYQPVPGSARPIPYNLFLARYRQGSAAE